MSLLTVLSGLGVGLLFGFALQRGRFCMNSAFRDPLVFKDYTLLKAVGVALLVQLIGFHILSSAGIITLAPKPFYVLAGIIGGFLFGLGMVIAGGCASGTAYRVGEGMLSSMVALLGFGLTAYLAKDGILSGATSFLQRTDWGNMTLSSLTSIPSWLFVLLFAVPGFLFLFRREKQNSQEAVSGDDSSRAATKDSGKKQDDSTEKTLLQTIFRSGWSWKVTGIVIGFIGILAFLASPLTGRNYPLGITMGVETIVKSLITMENHLTWESFEVLGLITGAFIAALLADEFKIRVPRLTVAVQSLGGGIMLGLGAVIADGCNVGHILSGVPQLAVGSIIAGIFIVLGAWAGAYVLFMRGDTL